MELDEWQSTVRFVWDDIKSIVRAQQIHSRIRNSLASRDLAPLEEDFIDADLNETGVGAPRNFDVQGVQIVVRKLHRRGIQARDVMGADLLYEIEDVKYAIMQYKTPSPQGRVTADARQLDELVESCPSMACDSRRPWPRCGSWHVIRGKDASLYHNACEARHIFGGAGSAAIASFSTGISKQTFDELFALCWIGAPLSPAGLGLVVASSINADRVLFSVSQRGRF